MNVCHKDSDACTCESERESRTAAKRRSLFPAIGGIDGGSPCVPILHNMSLSST